jgi:hypothetical protein
MSIGIVIPTFFKAVFRASRADGFGKVPLREITPELSVEMQRESATSA